MISRVKKSHGICFKNAETNKIMCIAGSTAKFKRSVIVSAWKIYNLPLVSCSLLLWEIKKIVIFFVSREGRTVRADFFLEEY